MYIIVNDYSYTLHVLPLISLQWFIYSFHANSTARYMYIYVCPPLPPKCASHPVLWWRALSWERGVDVARARAGTRLARAGTRLGAGWDTTGAGWDTTKDRAVICMMFIDLPDGCCCRDQITWNLIPVSGQKNTLTKGIIEHWIMEKNKPNKSRTETKEKLTTDEQ
jgi:hypothetical protein